MWDSTHFWSDRKTRKKRTMTWFDLHLVYYRRLILFSSFREKNNGKGHKRMTLTRKRDSIVSFSIDSIHVMHFMMHSVATVVNLKYIKVLTGMTSVGDQSVLGIFPTLDWRTEEISGNLYQVERLVSESKLLRFPQSYSWTNNLHHYTTGTGYYVLQWVWKVCTLICLMRHLDLGNLYFSSWQCKSSQRYDFRLWRTYSKMAWSPGNCDLPGHRICHHLTFFCLRHWRAWCRRLR